MRCEVVSQCSVGNRLRAPLDSNSKAALSVTFRSPLAGRKYYATATRLSAEVMPLAMRTSGTDKGRVLDLGSQRRSLPSRNAAIEPSAETEKAACFSKDDVSGHEGISAGFAHFQAPSRDIV